MTTIDPHLESWLKRGFKYLNIFMLLNWRLGLGQVLNIWPAVFGRIMVLIHTGRTSGLRRRTPLNYAIVDDELYCTAGFGAATHWYRNITAHPDVEVWLPEGWWAGRATDISHSPQRMRLLREVLIGSGFVAPLLGIYPRTMSDEELHRVTDSYRLVHIARNEARTGPDGPGDLAWLWPASTLLLLLWLLWLLRPRGRTSRNLRQR